MVWLFQSTRFKRERASAAMADTAPSPPADSQPSTSSRTTPREHAAKAFAPEDVPVPPVTLRGPLIPTTATLDPVPPRLSPEPSSPPQPPTGPPATDELPAPSPPPETVQPQGEIAAAGVEIVLGEDEQKDAAAWQRERIERKLRGEYERAGRHLAEITLRSLLHATRDLTATLEKFDIYRGIEASLERSDSVLSEKEDVDIVLRVREAPKYFLRTSTDVGDGEGNASATAKIRNAFGGAETIEGNVSFGTRTKSAFQVKLNTPVNSSTTTHADLSIFSAQRDLNFYASCHEATKGAMARLRTLSPLGYHEFAYEAVLRQIGDLAPTASMSMRNAAGPTVKSSISHTFTRDTRDDPFVATRGHYLRLRQEFAGLGGDAQFVKAEQEGSISRSLGGGYSASLSARSGLLLPLSRSGTSFFPDRYHLGGPSSVRHFRLNTMGPKDLGDYLGGDAFYAIGASLLTPFKVPTPWRKGEGEKWWSSENLKGHFWVNGGKLVGTGQPYSSLLNTPPSLTCGVGLMYRHSLVRIEANVGVPLVQTQGEGGVKGFQFGLGLSFL
ncbi:DEAD/DEAH box helicase domain protein [Rhodotorula toruloides ATCC 204091]|uniref:BY PROTMAP: gi/342319194/gb/EGU11144.1/ DEAD/DEAH box helicase domain protein [Rhodotorula glutinis ATCC 204091] n=1 Tax=Rhodotorula toruloides TaxID=5286 RepID=A0A0K3CIL7_RHOTO|nr:DEAD/DEAH box helicase domain protein [Rhodotorula toruloides ATCC 204091]